MGDHTNELDAAEAEVGEDKKGGDAAASSFVFVFVFFFFFVGVASFSSLASRSCCRRTFSSISRRFRLQIRL